MHQTSSDQAGKNKKILYSEKDTPLIIPAKATEFTVLYHIIHLVQLFQMLGLYSEVDLTNHYATSVSP